MYSRIAACLWLLICVSHLMLNHVESLLVWLPNQRFVLLPRLWSNIAHLPLKAGWVQCCSGLMKCIPISWWAHAICHWVLCKFPHSSHSLSSLIYISSTHSRSYFLHPTPRTDSVTMCLLSLFVSHRAMKKCVFLRLGVRMLSWRQKAWTFGCV